MVIAIKNLEHPGMPIEHHASNFFVAPTQNLAQNLEFEKIFKLFKAIFIQRHKIPAEPQPSNHAHPSR